MIGGLSREALLVLRTKVLGGEAIDKLQKKLSGVEGAAKKARSSFTGVVSSASWQAAAVAAAGIGAGLASSVKVAADFEQSMANVEAKLGASESVMAELGSTAKDLGRNTQFKAKEVGDAMDFLAMAGYDANEILAATPAILDLAVAGSTDLARTSDILSDTLGGLGLTANDTQMAADAMAAAVTSGNTTISMLGETMKMAAPNARDYGMTLQELAAMASVLGDDGIKATMAGRGLRKIMLNLAAPTKKVNDSLEALGVSAVDANGNFKPLQQLLGEMNTAMAAGNVTQAERLRILEGISGKAAANTFSSLLAAEASGKLNERLMEVTDSEGASARMAQVVGDTMSGAMKRLGSAVEGFQLALMGDQGGMKEFVDGLASGINKLTDVMNKFPKATAAVVLLSAAFAALVALAPFIAAFLSVLGSVAGALKGIGVALAGVKLVATIGTWAGAVLPVLAGIGAAFKTLLAIVAGVLTGPVGWVALLAAAVAALVAFREPIGAFFGWVGQQFVAWIASLWEWGEPIREFWVGLWDGARDAAMTFFGWISSGVSTYIVEPILALGSVLTDAMASVWEAVKGPILAFFGWWGGILYQLYVEPWLKSMELLGKIAAAAWKTIQDGSEFLWTAFRVATDIAVRWFAEQVEKYISQPFDRAVSQVSRIMAGLWGQIRSGASSFWTWLTTQVDTYVVKPFLSARDQIAETWGDFSQVIANGLTAVGSLFFEWVVKPIQEAWTKTVEWFGSTGTRIAEALKSGFDAIAGGISGAFKSTVEGVISLINKIIGFVNKAIGALNRLRAAGGMSAIQQIGNVGVPAFAEGGYVNRPTLGVIGEGGEGEYIIPASKMASAMGAFMSGRRGESVLSGGGGPGGAAGVSVTVKTGPVVSMEGRKYVTIEDLEGAAQQIASQIYSGLRAPAGRRAVGIA